MKIPLFDVDGTLVKGFVGVHGDALDEALKTVFDIGAHFDEINVQGKIDPQILVEVGKRHGVVEEKGKTLLPKSFAVMREYIATHKDEARYEILPGANDLFEELHANGVPIGLLTGNIEEAPEMKLGPSGLWDFVNFGAYGPEATSLKRAELVSIAQRKASELLKRLVGLNELVIIGDTPKDIECAKDGGILSIGVATGMYTEDDLRNAGANLVVSSLEERGKIIEFLEK